MAVQQSKAEKVEAYFSGVASGYQSASDGRVWSLVRRREARAVAGLLGDLRGREVLELGCGAGYYTRMMLALGAQHVWAVDISQAMLDQLPRPGVTALLGDASSINPGRSFQTLLSAGMLEFVDAPDATLKQAAALATPDASLTLLFPMNSLLGRAYRRFHRKNGLNIRLFDVSDMKALATSAGWTLEKSVQAGPYSIAARLIRGDQ